jgi:hypothetical protein
MLSFRDYVLREEFFQSVILGDVDTASTLGIITAENPDDGKLTKTGNERKNKELCKDLEKLGFAPIQMSGKFSGKAEKPFLVINIDRTKLIDLAKKYRQQSVIYGERKGKFIFTLIRNGRTVSKGSLVVGHPENLLDRNCYFKLGGDKFSLRFGK